MIDNYSYVSHYLSCVPSGLQGIHQVGRLRALLCREAQKLLAGRGPTTWAPTTGLPYPLTPGSTDLE